MDFIAYHYTRYCGQLGSLPFWGLAHKYVININQKRFSVELYLITYAYSILYLGLLSQKYF